MLKPASSIPIRISLVFKLVYTEEAKKKIARLDTQFKLKIQEAVETIAQNPFSGKHLTQELKGRMSYRVGDYRIIYKVFHKEILILILTVGHRRDVYIKQSRKNW